MQPKQIEAILSGMNMNIIDFYSDRISCYKRAARKSRSARVRTHMIMGAALAEALIDGREFVAIVDSQQFWPVIPANLWPAPEVYQ